MKKSMPAAKEHFEWHVKNAPGDFPIIFLGLGPKPDNIPEWFDFTTEETIYFVESQDFVDQADDQWAKAVPDNFTRIHADEFTAELAANAHVARYLPVQKALPSFYGPLTARLILGSRPVPTEAKTVWIPSGEKDLLGRELQIAFQGVGYTVRFLDHEDLGKHPGTILPELLADGAPDLFFSVNFKGIDHVGLGVHILREAGVKVAVWMVDNPFNLLPAVKSAYWQDIRLFVTDHSFIGPLIKTGARWVTHLPLAASPALFEDTGTLPDHAQDIDEALVFVGRSEFPDKNKFFAGITIDPNQVNALDNTDGPRRHDYHWWRKQMDITPLWPGNMVRRIGAAAEAASHVWKTDCLAAAGEITIFGDDGWKSINSADVRPMVDYYAHLPAIYRTAPVTLNITGMQLPAGLTQRHFDVWCAGGFLITDDNPGLNIFPKELVEPIRFTRPDEIRHLFHRHQKETEEKRALRQAWQDCILRDHTYHNRIETILSCMNLKTVK